MEKYASQLETETLNEQVRVKYVSPIRQDAPNFHSRACFQNVTTNTITWFKFVGSLSDGEEVIATSTNGTGDV